MLKSLFSTSAKEHRRYGTAFFAGIIAGILSAFVKSGTEGILPPRTPNRIAPPVQLLNDMGFNVNHMFYTYSDQVVYWGGNFVHILFSIFIAIFYCMVAEIFPKIKLWQGIIFGVIVAVVFHGVVLPLLHLSPPLTQLPFDEILSELVGTCIWMWSIEIIRMNLRYRITRQSEY